MNAPTFIIIVAIAILMVFALRRAYRVFSLKDDCCGGGPKAPKAKKVAAVTVEDTDEANYPFSLDVKVKGMTCEKCVGRVQNALNAQPAHILAKSPIDRDAVERAVEDAGYYVSHRD